ncbi:oligosaccharide flippase family protein [Flavobacterium sp. TP390]|uniref:Oligosaccharide flippase family protein n=1 Tax=Flavobacterium profundi TaxID=1774945 RepID=A0A6I4IIL2_9FLAO|nr:polysaccharide biosynthesis C-terminal domain-containing protein [Flavobacterium profundi]MVO09603.1 oligosaccharide flippase family protein [Flavobacterium profundi]
MSIYKSLFKQTAIYGLATVLPRMFSFILVPLYTDPKVLNVKEYGEVSIIFSWLVFFNVILSYGMETSFFRFFSKEDNKNVVSTSTISLFWSSIAFLIIALLGRNYLAKVSNIDVEYIVYAIWILVLDALVIIPFSKLRAEKRPIFYALIKIGNVALNLFLNLFFLLWLPKIVANVPTSFISAIYFENFQIGYIFVANIIASLATFLVLSPSYFKMNWHFDKVLWKKMMQYSLPVMVAGIAFAINETFDRILLDYILPESIAKTEIGAYSACYKLALFMTLFATAFRLGIEPFFFSHSSHQNATKTYADITKYFVVFGSIILLVVVVFADVLKLFIIRDASYWEAMKVVPLIILANFFLGIYNNLSVWYKLTDKTKMGMYISIIGAIVTLVINFLLIPMWSYMGSAIATISAYGTMMLISYYLGNKYYPIPYDMKKIMSYLILSIGLSGLSFYIKILRETYVFGILAVLFYAYFVYRNEKELVAKLIKRK